MATSFGNLFIVAMMGVTGSFERALHESSRVLAVRGQVLPSTLENVNLRAEMEEGALVVVGESKITETGQQDSPPLAAARAPARVSRGH